MRNGGKREKTILTSHGEIRIKRTILKTVCIGNQGYDNVDRVCDAEICESIKREKQTAPLDEQLGIAGLPFKMSQKLMERTAFLGQGQSSYKMAKTMTDMFTAVNISESTIKEVSDYAGKKTYEAEKREAEEIGKKSVKAVDKGEKEGILYVMADGALLNTRRKNEEGSGWRESKLGEVFNMKKKGGKERITNKEYTACLGKAEEFKEKIYAAAIKNGYLSKYERTVFISDGAAWLRNLCKDIFPDAVQILDYYHLSENINNYAKVIFANNEEERKRWAEEMTGLARDSRIEEMIKEAERYRKKKTAEGTVNLLGYLKENKDRIDYAKYRREGLMIGSGPIESGNKTVMQKRMKQAGMRWDPTRAQHMLSLRAKWESRLWQDVCRAIA